MSVTQITGDWLNYAVWVAGAELPQCSWEASMPKGPVSPGEVLVRAAWRREDAFARRNWDLPGQGTSVWESMDIGPRGQGPCCIACSLVACTGFWHISFTQVI